MISSVRNSIRRPSSRTEVHGLEYETDSNDVFYVRVDRTRKVPITVLIRALGIGTNAEIINLFGEEPEDPCKLWKRHC